MVVCDFASSVPISPSTISFLKLIDSHFAVFSHFLENSLGAALKFFDIGSLTGMFEIHRPS